MAADLNDVTGRSALVTGAGGLGQAVAAALAARGASVVLADRDEQRAEHVAQQITDSGAPGKTRGVRLDVSDVDAVRACVDGVVADRGRLDILVNTAAILERGAAVDYDIALFRQMMDINVVGTFACCQAAGRVMLEAERGTIVNFASVAGLVGYGGTPAYQASKAAIIQITRALAMEWAPHVRVNAVAPGSVNTPMTAAIEEHHAEFRKAFIARIPLGRPAEPSEIVEPVLLLCSDASSYMTGQVLTVDGGYTVQ